MGVVFAVLTVLAVFIKVFDRVDTWIPAGDVPDSDPGSSSTAIASPASPATAIAEPNEAETAAVIAVALALADAERGSSSGGPPSAVRQTTGSSWVATGRLRELSGRMSGLPGRGRRNP